MKLKQHNERNLSMVMDFYELTMSNGYFYHNYKDTLVSFDIFFRKNPDGSAFSIFAGLEQIVEYIENLHFSKEDIDYLKTFGFFHEEFLEYLLNFKFKGTITSVKEGTIIYPNTPIITVIAPLIDAQLIETAILLQVNHQTLIASKARRIKKSVGSKAFISNFTDFGARRAHNVDSAVYGARSAFIGGADGTATVLAGQMFDIPVSGTMAHSWIMFFKDEFLAFKNYATSYPNASVFLVDTYDVLKSGIPNAIRVAKEILEPMSCRLKGVRLDSGDLAYLSKEARKMLDEAGLTDCKIIASNSLDEYTIQSLISQGAKIDSFGVGERLITSKSEPVFGAVYKLASVYENGKFNPRIKVSENVEKVTNPGLKELYRYYDSTGHAVADILAVNGESLTLPLSVVDTERTWKKRVLEDSGCLKKLHETIFKDGELVYELPTLKEIKQYVESQLENEIWEEEQRLANPHIHYLDMTHTLYDLKLDLLNEVSDSYKE